MINANFLPSIQNENQNNDNADSTETLVPSIMYSTPIGNYNNDGSGQEYAYERVSFTILDPFNDNVLSYPEDLKYVPSYNIKKIKKTIEEENVIKEVLDIVAACKIVVFTNAIDVNNFEDRHLKIKMDIDDGNEAKQLSLKYSFNEDGTEMKIECEYLIKSIEIKNPSVDGIVYSVDIDNIAGYFAKFSKYLKNEFHLESTAIDIEKAKFSFTVEGLFYIDSNEDRKEITKKNEETVDVKVKVTGLDFSEERVVDGVISVNSSEDDERKIIVEVSGEMDIGNIIKRDEKVYIVIFDYVGGE